MQIKSVIASVVGPISETHWGQILQLPHAYGVVEIHRPSGGALQHGIHVLAKLTDRLNKPPISLKEVEAIAQEMGNESIVSLILFIPVGAVVYVVIRGNGAVYLARGEELAVLVKEAGAISGEMKEGDTLLLASAALTSVLSQKELSMIFDHLAPKEAAEKLTLALHGQDATVSGSAALIFQATELVPVEEAPLSSEEVLEVSAIAQPNPPAGRYWPRHFFSRVKTFRPHHFSHQRKPKLVTVVAAGLFILFGVSVVFGLVKQTDNTKAQAVNQAIVNAQHVFDEGSALLTLNAAKGRERLSQAKTILEPFIKTTSPKSKEGKKLASLYQQIVDNLTQSLAVTHGEPQLFYDVSLVKKGAIASSMAVSGDTLALVDVAGRTVYTLDIGPKNGKVIAGGDGFEGITLVGTTSDMMYILTNSGIHVVNIKNKTTKQSVIKKDDQWGTITAMNAFGGNIYLADTGKGRIWKYVATDAGFTDRREYLNPDTLPDLTHATSMAIDGSVWLGKSDGKMLRFTQGKESAFVPQGVEPGFGSNLFVYTSDEVKNIYVLDKEKKRVVVLDKDGVYGAQYVWEGNVAPTQLVVSEEQKKVLLLADGKIYALDLK